MLGFRQGRIRGGGDNPTTMEAVDFYFRVSFPDIPEADSRLSCHFETVMAVVFLARWTSLRRPGDTSQRVCARRNDFKAEATEIAAAQSDRTLVR